MSLPNGWRNTSNYKIGFEVQATKRLKVRIDLNDFYLATVQDALYTDNCSAVATNPKATGRHVGWEPDVQAMYKLTKQISVGGGYGPVIPAEYLKQSTKGYAYYLPYLSWEFRY